LAYNTMLLPSAVLLLGRLRGMAASLCNVSKDLQEAFTLCDWKL
jgi:hypothetical protein